jgi:hypothetical protein
MDPRLARLQREIASAISGLTPDQLRRSSPGKWCIAEILEHLYLTYTGTVKGFSRILTGGKPLASKATWTQRGRALVVVGFGYMPKGRKSPAVGLPRGIPAEKITADIDSTISDMDEVMNRCATKLGSHTKVLDHPILGALSIHEWRKFHLVHGLHHVKQMQALRAKVMSGEL